MLTSENHLKINVGIYWVLFFDKISSCPLRNIYWEIEYLWKKAEMFV